MADNYVPLQFPTVLYSSDGTHAVPCPTADVVVAVVNAPPPLVTVMAAPLPVAIYARTPAPVALSILTTRANMPPPPVLTALQRVRLARRELGVL